MSHLHLKRSHNKTDIAYACTTSNQTWN